LNLQGHGAVGAVGRSRATMCRVTLAIMQ
jgi:hypothetical protein